MDGRGRAVGTAMPSFGWPTVLERYIASVEETGAGGFSGPFGHRGCSIGNYLYLALDVMRRGFCAGTGRVRYWYQGLEDPRVCGGRLRVCTEVGQSFNNDGFR